MAKATAPFCGTFAAKRTRRPNANLLLLHSHALKKSAELNHSRKAGNLGQQCVPLSFSHPFAHSSTVPIISPRTRIIFYFYYYHRPFSSKKRCSTLTRAFFMCPAHSSTFYFFWIPQLSGLKNVLGRNRQERHWEKYNYHYFTVCARWQSERVAERSRWVLKGCFLELFNPLCWVLCFFYISARLPARRHVCIITIWKE